MKGAEPIVEAIDTVRKLQQLDIDVCVLTNSSWSNRQQLRDRLRKGGFIFNVEDIVTSGYATALYIKENHGRDSRFLVLGGDGIMDELRDVCIGTTIVEASDDVSNVQAVIVGIDRNLSYERLSAAQLAIVKHGALFVATNVDPVLPGAARDYPGAGCIVKALETACGRCPDVVVGKPEPTGLQLLMRKKGRLPSETLMIGDRLDTDIEAGVRAGTLTALVETGIHSSRDFKRLWDCPDGNTRPFVLTSLGELFDMFSIGAQD